MPDGFLTPPRNLRFGHRWVTVSLNLISPVTSSQLTEHLLLEIFGFLVCESILARCQIA